MNFYIRSIQELLGELNLSDEEINLYIYGQSLNEVDFFKKPLSKLTYDIMKKQCILER